MFLNDPLLRQDPNNEANFDIANILQRVNVLSTSSDPFASVKGIVTRESTKQSFDVPEVTKDELKILIQKVDEFYKKFASMDSMASQYLIKVDKEVENMDNDEKKLSKMIQNLTTRFQNMNTYLQKMDEMKAYLDKVSEQQKFETAANKPSTPNKDYNEKVAELKELRSKLEQTTKEKDTLQRENTRIKDEVYLLRKNIENSSYELERLRTIKKMNCP